MSRFDQGATQVRIAQLEDRPEVLRGRLPGSNCHEQGSAGALVSMGVTI